MQTRISTLPHPSRRSHLSSATLVMMHPSWRLARSKFINTQGRINFPLRNPTQTVMHSVLLVFLPLLGLYILQSLFEFRRIIRGVGWVPWPLQPHNEITESSFGSLSGPRVLITPISALAQLARLVLPPFRYVIREYSWVIKNGNRGRDMQLVQVIICESWSYADFAAAGQDAFAMVGLLYHAPHIEGRDLMTVICQVSVWPPRTDIYLADAAAIKVRDTLPRT